MYPLEFVPVLSGRYRPLLQKVAKCKKYNKFKDFAFNTLAFQKVTNMTFKYSNFRALKSVNPKSSGGSAPWTPGRGSAPAPPPGALRRAPGPHPKSARAYALAMCAPRTCLPPPKKSARAYALAMCAPRTCLPNKNRTRAIQKKSARASRSLCALRAHVCPPIINRCPLLAPPTFFILVPPLSFGQANTLTQYL